MRRVVVLGPGGAGKSVFAARLGAALALPVVELDRHFWASDRTPTPKDAWVRVQRRLIGPERWVLDGDLGPYDEVGVRLRAADTVVLLDLPLRLCAWRALRRSRESAAFWRWLLTYRHRSLPAVTAAIAEHAGRARVQVLRTPRAVEQFLIRAGSTPMPR